MVQIGNSWDSLLSSQWDMDYYKALHRFLATEYKTQTIYPPMFDIFSALRYTAYEDVKVIILGQDPYHGEGQAHGLAFSVQKGVKIPPSLQNIYKELERDLGVPAPSHGCLTDWAKNGVLLLNTVLTVRSAQPNSHKGMGWETFTNTVITLLNQRTQPLVFLLWGNNAKQKQALLTNPAHLVLTSVHPSPLSAYNGFMGCGHFSKATDFLKQHGVSLDWHISE